MEPGQKKNDFDKEPVLDRMEIQLKKSGILTEYVKNIDLNWAMSNESRLIRQYANNEYILLFPFCSIKHLKKKWPYFFELIIKLKEIYKNKYPILIAPGPNELKDAKKLNAKVVTDNNKKNVDIKTLITLIHNAKFIVSNDTGPAHIASHLGKKGLALFGSHTSAKKVSIESYNFKVLSVKDLAKLEVDTVIKEIRSKLD